MGSLGPDSSKGFTIPSIRRILFACACLLVLTMGTAVAGTGSGYEPTDVQAEVNDDGSVTVTGENCPPNSNVHYVVRKGPPPSPDGEVVDEGDTTSDADGHFEFTTDPLPNGEYTIEVTCGGNSTVLGVTVNRGTGGGNGGNPPAGGGGTDLPRTGDDTSIPLARLAAVLLATGGVALYAAKKRQNRRSAFTAT